MGAATALATLRRSERADLRLATALAAIAGAANAGGFFALGSYTSHMTGYLSHLADELVLWNLAAMGTSLLAIGAFVSGAAFSTILINWARAADRRRQYAWPLAMQGLFMLAFAGGGLGTGLLWQIWSLCCLCFIMGMQNATITKISNARIRTTHATGMVTDIGIELGRGLFHRLAPAIAARIGTAIDRRKLVILLRLVGAFVLGGVIGAAGYARFGFLFSLPLAAVLLALSLPVLILHRGRRKPAPHPAPEGTAKRP